MVGWSEYSPWDRRAAARENRKLITVNVDGCCQDPPTGGWHIQAPVPEACVQELRELVERWRAEGRLP